VSFLRRHAILGAATGSGKSGGLNELIASLAACRDTVIWGVDLKRGVELKPWARCFGRLATTPPEAAALLADAVTIPYARADHMADQGWREWQPSQAMPALVVIIDEYAELAEQAPPRAAQHRHHRPARTRAGRDPGSRHPAANPESHGTRRAACPDEHPHSVPRPRAARRSTWS
jgi:S-DNA-T family DNA segregation ATPase FtsK/SpoIIIE